MAGFTDDDSSHVLLGKPTFEPIGNDRVKCVETGHEMPRDQALSYSTSKKCLEALFNVALAQGKPPLNFFHQSPDARNMVVCKLTGALVKKDEDTIWKHVMGKKFQRRLDGAVQKDTPEIDRKEKGKKKLTKKAGVKMDAEVSCVASSLDEDEEPDFWMPPVGERWDFDSGGDRWATGVNPKAASSNELSGRCLVQAANEANEGVDGGAESDSRDNSQSGSESDVIRLKRLSLSKSSRKSANLRKKRKTNC